MIPIITNGTSNKLRIIINGFKEIDQMSNQPQIFPMIDQININKLMIMEYVN